MIAALSLTALRALAGRWFNRDTLLAFVVMVLAAGAVAGAVAVYQSWEQAIVDRVNAGWELRLAKAREEAAKAERSRQASVMAAAEAARTEAELAREGALALAADLERALAEAERTGGDPVVLPKQLVRRLK
jgi:hypothetical protein